MATAVCLVSGGLDSCVAAACAVQEGETAAFLHLSYGQLTEERERRAFLEIADFYEVRERLVISVAHLARIGGSALTDSSISLPEGDPDRSEIPSSYVPFRNANFLSVAVSWAEVLEARSIFIGAVQEDSSGYPDCRAGFFEAFQSVVEQGTKPGTSIELKTPLLRLRKRDIVRKGVDLGAPLDRTWSCYRGLEKACGRCDSCLLRLRGFEEAGVSDPIPYERRP